MRVSLENLIQNSIVLQYQLPHDIAGIHIPRTHISTEADDCLFQTGSDEDIAKLIYNGIVDYAYNDNDIDLTRLNSLQMRALQSKLKYNSHVGLANQLAYGFHGEVLLHLILSYFYQASKAIARGYLFSALENSETKGYDSYLMVENGNNIDLLFGEAKFYIEGYRKSLKAIFDNIKKVLTDEYLNRNFIAMDNQYEHLNPASKIPLVIDQWRDNPLINMAVEARKYNMQLVYPMLVIFDDKANTYEDLILKVVTHIRTKYGNISPKLTIPCSLFFIFFPVGNSKIIKTKVLQWINQQQPLMP